MNEFRLSEVEVLGAIADYLNLEKFQKPHRVLSVRVHEDGDFLLEVEEIKKPPRRSRAKHRPLSVDEITTLNENDHADR